MVEGGEVGFLGLHTLFNNYIFLKNIFLADEVISDKSEEGEKDTVNNEFKFSDSFAIYLQILNIIVKSK